MSRLLQCLSVPFAGTKARKCYVRPVRRIGTGIRSGPVRSAVSDRSRTDLGPDRFDEIFFFRRRAIFKKKSLERCGRFRQKIDEIGAILAIFEPFEV